MFALAYVPLRALGFLDRNQLKQSQQVFSTARPAGYCLPVTTQTVLVIKKVKVGHFLLGQIATINCAVNLSCSEGDYVQFQRSASVKSLTKQVSRISPFLEDSSDLRVLIAGGSEVFVLNDQMVFFKSSNYCTTFSISIK